MANQAQNTNQAAITSVGTATAGGTANSAKPAIVGTAQPYSTVEIFDGGRLIGIAGVDMYGNWTFAPSSNMSSGVHQFSALAIDTMGVFGPMSTPVSVSIPAPGPVAPQPPVIQNVIDAVGPVQGNVPSGGTTDDNHPTISGTGIPGYTIYVYQNGLGCADTVVDSTGHWSVKVTGAMSDGLHNMTATQFPNGGAASVASNTWAITIDTTKPAPPVITGLTDDYGRAIAAGSLTTDMHPTLNGTGKAGDIVMLYDGSKLIGSASIDPSGHWSVKPSTDLSTGTHDLYVIETNAAGVSSGPSAHTSITTSLTTPSPVITSVVDAVGPVQGNVPSGGTTDDTRPTISGTGIPGDTLYIYLANSSNYGGQAYGAGDTVVDASGHWSIRLNKEMPSGVNTITALQFLPGGAQSAPTAGWVVTVDTTKPATPATPTLSDDSGATIPAGSTTANNHPHINGTGKAGDIITVYDGSTVIGSTTVGSNSQWSFATGSLSTGSHSFNVTETNGAGVSSQHSGSIGFTYANGSAAPVITNMVDTVGPVQGTIPNNGVTDDSHPTVSGTGVAGSIVRIYQNGSGCGTTIVDATGHWSVKVVDTLTDGVHAIVATQISSGQTLSPISNTWTIWIQTTAPDTPAAPTLTDDSGANIPAGTTTFNVHPHINGTGKSGDIIKVYDGSSVIGSTTVGGDGKWSFTPSTNLSAGGHSFHVTETNSVGSTSAASPDTKINVNTAGPILFARGSNPDYFCLSSPGHVIKDVVYFDNDRQWHSVYLSSGSGNKAIADCSSSPFFASNGNAFGVQLKVITDIGTYVFNSFFLGFQSTSTDWVTIGAQLISAPGGVSATRFIDDSDANAANDSAPLTEQSAPITEKSTAVADHHTIVGEHDAFVGKLANGNETVDLNTDPASYFKESTAHIEGAKGGAIDTLHLTGDHQVLDLTSLTGKTAAAKISGIEVVDLGGQHNTLKLSLIDVLNLGETDLFQKDGKQQMMVQGKDGDTVDLSNTHIAGLADGEWAQQGTAVVGGVTYNVYEHSGAHTELLVQQGVQIVVH